MTTLRTLPEALAAAASTEAGYTFLAPGGAVRRSYAEIRQQALRVARSLEEAGLRRGDLVALVIGDSEQFLTSLFAASIAGLVPVSLFSPATSGDQARYLEMTSGVLRASGARAIVTSSGLVSALSALREHCPSLDIVLSYDTLDAPACEPSRQLSLDDLAFIQFTSGSTSAPKGIALTHRNVAANIAAFAACLDVQKDDVGLSWLPLNHDMGLVGMAIGSVYASVSTVLLTPVMFVKRPAEWLKAITRFRASVSFAPNFAYDLAVRRVKEKDLEGLDLSSWRVAGCGAEPVHAPTLAAFAERFASVGFRETAFLPSYGLAEHVLAATFSPVGRGPRVEQVAAEALTERYLAVPAATGDKTVSLVSCGSQLPGHVLKIVGEDGRRLADREVGEIVLGGPSVMVGYYNADKLTALTIQDGWLHTGDLGYLSGGELFVCGRIKDLIIVNGRKFHPQDLEWAAGEVGGVRHGRVVAFGTTEHGGADRVVLVVELSGTVPGDELSDAIRRKISDVLGLFVDEIVTVPSGSIARTTSGKVQRALTKARYESGALADKTADQAESYA